MEHVPADVTAEIHGYSHPDAMTWRFPG